MAESGDYQPAACWSGHSFASARGAYVDHAARSYTEAKAKKVSRKSVLPSEIVCDAEVPIVIWLDETGSMDQWPPTIMSKIPYVAHEATEYFGDDWAVMFGGVGDAFNGEDYPVQAKKFMRKKDFEDEADAIKDGKWQPIIFEGKGGGSGEESYDLAALYSCRCVKMPKAIRKPILIWICDEGIYDAVDSALAKAYLNITLEGNIPYKQIFEELTEKYAVYVVRKPYGGVSSDKAVHKQWADVLGEDHVINLQDPNRVVDVIFGIFAKETDRIDYFEDELKDRQGKDKDGPKKIDVVLKSLHSIHGNRATLPKLAGPVVASGAAGRSITRRKTGGAKSISLLDDE